ncbi:MAG: hypothetical protein JNN01_11355, partial [Opitutaceae bacterium]|nr:hypothetical protein [Opitutaceae bacterium]
LVDPSEANDWEVTFTIDLAASRTAARVVFQFVGVAPIGGMAEETEVLPA